MKDGEGPIEDFSSMADERLMQLYQQGDSGAFEELYSRHSGRVYAYLKKRLPGPGEAEDILQQTFLKLHRNRSGYDPALPFLPWIFSIARNGLVDALRKHRPTPVEDPKLVALADRRQEPSAEGEATGAGWEEILALLPENQRRLIQLRYGEGMSFEEIASLSDLKEASVRQRISRAVRGLRKKFSGKGTGS